MDSSLSSPHHRRKLSGVNGFSSSKNAYDDIFSGPATFGARKIKSRVFEDYKEIFPSSRDSSIPILNITRPGDVDVDASSDFRNSELDYSNIFGGLKEVDAGVSYEQVVANANANAAGPKRETTSSHKIRRTPSAAGSPVHSSDCVRTSGEDKVFPSDASYQSFDDKKHFSVSYHKINTGSKDGTNGTTHVAQFHPVRGFTCFVDETTPQKIEADKPKYSGISDIRRKVDVNQAVPEDRYPKKGMSHFSNKETSGREHKSNNGFRWDGSYCYDKLSNAHENSLKSHPSEKQPPSSIPTKIDSYGNSKRSMASNSNDLKCDGSEHVAGEGSPCLFGEEFNVNSAAAASAAVLKDAIQKAQESIRIAKELMERKKKGLRSRSSHSFRNSMKVKDGRQNNIVYESNRLDDTNAKETSGSVDYVSHLLSGMRKKSALRSGLVSDFKERTFITEYVLDNEHAKNVGTAEKCKPPSIEKEREVIPCIDSMDKHESNVMEVHILNETLEQQQGVVVHKENTDDKAQELVYMKGKLNTVKGEKETENSADIVEPVCIVCEHEEIENFGIFQEDEFIEEIHTYTHIDKDGEGEKRSKDSQQKNENALRFESGNDLRVDNVQELEDIENKQEVNQQDHILKTTKDFENEGSTYTVEKICDEVDDERFEDAFQWVEEGHELKEACGRECKEKQGKEIYMRPDAVRRPEKVHEQEIDEMTRKDIHDGKKSEQFFEDFELERKNLTGRFEKTESIHIETEKREVLPEVPYETDYKGTDVCSHDVREKNETRKAFQYKINHVHSETGQEVDDHEGSIEATEDSHGIEVNEAEAVILAYKLREREHLRTGKLAQYLAKESEIGSSVNVVSEVSPSNDSPPKFGSTYINFGEAEFAQRSDMDSDSNLDCGIDILASESTEEEDVLDDRMSSNEEAEKSRLGYVNFKQHDDNMQNFEISQGPSVSKANEKTVKVDIEIKTRQNTRKNEEDLRKTIMMEKKEMKTVEEIQARRGKKINDESPSKVFVMDEKETKTFVSEVVKEKECMHKNNEEKNRDLERGKEKIAVERAIREARERAFAEARERAERAAVERATAEVRQRVMTEAREKFDTKTAATKLSTEKVSVEAKLRSERAAVERATSEARERALEKALSQKSRAHTGGSISQNLTGLSSDSVKQSSSSVLETKCENNTESVQRNKANVEKQERIMERTAKALAEKNMRDLLAQKEQAEKSRLAEALDVDIKRWSSGKEGNLRALLSTLQYILGPGSGWQPISLTEIITTNAVKKAYRKATLYVHPDKLQQRGESIQQKYICEKVFDLLKAAWNKFNKEER